MAKIGTAVRAAQRNHLFVDGFLSGQKGERMSPREVLARFPNLNDWEVIIYLNGQDDGRANDRFRVNRMGAGALLAKRAA